MAGNTTQWAISDSLSERSGYGPPSAPNSQNIPPTTTSASAVNASSATTGYIICFDTLPLFAPLPAPDQYQGNAVAPTTKLKQVLTVFYKEPTVSGKSYYAMGINRVSNDPRVKGLVLTELVGDVCQRQSPNSKIFKQRNIKPASQVLYVRRGAQAQSPGRSQGDYAMPIPQETAASIRGATTPFTVPQKPRGPRFVAPLPWRSLNPKPNVPIEVPESALAGPNFM